jgi:uncharacterized protein YciI
VNYFLYRIQPTRPEMLRDGLTENEAEVVGRHFKYLQQLVSEGVVVMAGRTLNTDESAFGIVVFRAPSQAEARKLMQNDPAVAGGVMHADLFPYRIALLSAGGWPEDASDA